MVILGIVLQVVLHISETRNGNLKYMAYNSGPLIVQYPQVLLFPLKMFSALYLLNF